METCLIFQNRTDEIKTLLNSFSYLNEKIANGSYEGLNNNIYILKPQILVLDLVLIFIDTKAKI